MQFLEYQQVADDWNTKLLVDIKVVESTEICSEAFEADEKDVQELFPNAWYGERKVYV